MREKKGEEYLMNTHTENAVDMVAILHDTLTAPCQRSRGISALACSMLSTCPLIV